MILQVTFGFLISMMSSCNYLGVAIMQFDRRLMPNFCFSDAWLELTFCNIIKILSIFQRFLSINKLTSLRYREWFMKVFLFYRKCNRRLLQLRISGLCFNASVTVEKRYQRHNVFGTVRPWVSESLRPENLVHTISQKPMKGMSPNFGRVCIWVHRYAD